MTKVIAEFDTREVALIKKSLVGLYTKLEQQESQMPYMRLADAISQHGEDKALRVTEMEKREQPMTSKEVEKLLVKLFALEE